MPFDRHYPRLRRRGKWLGLVLLLFILAIDIASTRWGTAVAGVDSAGQIVMYPVGIGGGRIWFVWEHPRPWNSLTIRGPILNLQWPSWKFDGSIRRGPGYTYWDVMIPLWAPALLLAILTAALWWRDRPSRRRRLAGQCPACGYSRAGLGDHTPCPECGRVRPSAAR